MRSMAAIPLVVTVPVLALVWTIPASAEPIHPAIREATMQVKLGVGQWDQDYTEFDDDSIVPTAYLDKENGSVPAFAVEIGALNEAGLFSELRLLYATGETDYDGYAQQFGTGALRPITTTTNNDFYDLRYQLGYMFGVHERVAVTPKVEFGYTRWDRMIQSVGVVQGLDETYTMIRGAVGAQVDMVLTPELVLTLEGMLGRQNADIQVDSFNFDEDLGTNAYNRLALELDYAVSEQVHLGVSAARIEYDYSESAVSSGFLEPRSDTVHTTVLANIGFTF